MENLKVEKIVSALPWTLTANTLYLVRVGLWFDFYVTNSTGTIVAYKANGWLSNVTIDFLDPEVLADLKYNFAATFTNDSNWNPTHIEETWIGSNARKRITDFTYDGSQNIITQEIRIKDSWDVFLFGFRKNFSYAWDSISSITIDSLSS